MAAPFQLDDGLYLERARVLVPWDTPFETLATITYPTIVPQRTTVGRLSWPDELIVGGIRADVWYDDGHGKVFSIFPRELGHDQRAYDSLVADLTGKLGAPHDLTVEQSYPWARWFYGPVRVSVRLYERFVLHLSFMITKGV